ncbi:SDR family NAD(P)-dependent oxidoreductase [Nemorincola caseinilytica]|uniref:SDR family NAD(P)-dependent oxidoreductase n=1 Tax=Nemorincola caseinilytica TaxID=2054315 RepID=A0ABP8NLU0_9BACT
MSRTILITGATAGFGRAIAERCAKEGYTVCITGRREERLKALKEELEAKYGVRVIPLCFDVRDSAQVAAAITELKQQVDRIDVLVNNAGLAAGLSTIDEGELADWEVMIDTNIKGLVYMTRQVAPMMREQASGHIINIGSTAGKTVYRNGNVYCATKFAVDALTQATRIDMLQYGIKVTSINPGMAETEFSLVRYKGDEERAANMYKGVRPLQAEDIADILWYCINLPPHVCINDLTVTCLTQVNSVYHIKEAERIVK